jgi:hypothetical protein
MRTTKISLFAADEAAAEDAIAKLLLDLPPAGDDGDGEPKKNYLHFDRRGAKHTVAWRYRDGRSWGVTFRDPPTSADKRRRYDNPVETARAIIARDHAPYAGRVFGARNVTDELLLANNLTVCPPAAEGR